MLFFDSGNQRSSPDNITGSTELDNQNLLIGRRIIGAVFAMVALFFVWLAGNISLEMPAIGEILN
jgi:hypothetical protein